MYTNIFKYMYYCLLWVTLGTVGTVGTDSTHRDKDIYTELNTPEAATEEHDNDQ